MRTNAPGNNYYNNPQTITLRKPGKKSQEENQAAFLQPSIDKLPNLDRHHGLPNNPLNVSRMFAELPVSRYATEERMGEKRESRKQEEWATRCGKNAAQLVSSPQRKRRALPVTPRGRGFIFRRSKIKFYVQRQ